MASSSNSKKLLKNTILFAFSSFIPKVLSFLLVPVYTSYLTAEDYGASELIITTASLLLPIFTLNISSSVMRFTIETKDDKRAYVLGMQIVALSSLLLAVVMLIACMVFNLPINYAIFIFLLFVVSADYQVKIAYMRAMERVMFLTICGIVNSFVMLLANILFITVFRFGMYGFVCSSILGYLVANVLMAIASRKDDLSVLSYSLWKEKVYLRELLAYSAPLVLSGISWWITSVSDKYVLSMIVGVAATGLYSVATKIPTILQTLHDVFSQAWQLQVYDVYKNDDGMEYIGRTYEMYNFMMVFACSVLIFLDKPLSRMLFANEFYNAWKYVPVLLISVVFLSVNACSGVMFSVYKQSQLSAKGSVINACINTSLNFILIYLVGIQGAALATLCSYIFSWCFNWYHIRKMCAIPVNLIKCVCMYILLGIETIIVLYVPRFWVSGIVVAILALINHHHIIVLVQKSMVFAQKLRGKIISMRER